ncbi:MAG: hypothetical protein A3K10_13435 [Bacteroidetes bacterium RIFCSPLOWO2_12_FULL_31_6]|nr:MAG: hypothetical protein A3K10_13435 [Bacteroidetes bacterium RIFCSPLOWO2_12_FULL_31_6]
MNTNRIIQKSICLLLFSFYGSNSTFAQIQAPSIENAETVSCGVKDDNGKDVKLKCGQSITLSNGGQKMSCTCNCGVGGGVECVPISQTTNATKPLPTVPSELQQLNSLIDLLSPTNTDSKTSAEIEAEKKELAEKKAIEERMGKEKSTKLKAELKPIEESYEMNEKAACMKAQKEVYRLLTLKIKFENQLFYLKKWSSNLDDLEKGFIDDKNAYTKGFSDDLLNLIPIDYIKGVTPVALGEKIEKAVSTTKMLKTSVENALELKENLGDSVVNKMNLANQSYSYTGEMLEGASVFMGEKYSKTMEQAGKCLQMNSSSLGMVQDNSEDNIANTLVDAVGIIVPPAGLAAAGTRIALKSIYEIYSDWQIHKLSTTKSENKKAQEFLMEKIKELDMEISFNQNIVDEYKKIKPAGCPVY